MAYNNFYPNYTMQNQTYQPQLQRNAGFVLVRSEEEVWNYPVAYGTSVLFKNETAPYIYTKTMGMSQMDRPVVEKYKLIKETAQEPAQGDAVPKIDNEAVEKLQSEIGAIWREIEAVKKSVEEGA